MMRLGWGGMLLAWGLCLPLAAQAANGPNGPGEPHNARPLAPPAARGPQAFHGSVHGPWVRGGTMQGRWSSRQPGELWHGPMQRNSPAALARLAENTRIRQRLGLTPAQVTKIEGYAFDWRKDQINARAQEQIAQLELHRLRQATTPDEPAIDQKLTAISGLRLGMAKSDVHYRLAMRSVLTPAQQRQARAWMHRRGSMHPMDGRMRGMDRRSMGAPRMERHGSGSGSESTAS